MKVIIGKNSGFCFGVKRAVDDAFSLKGERKFVLGEIIHNEIVLKKLADAGVKSVESVEEIDAQNATVIIRSHGAKKSVYEQIERKIHRKEKNTVTT